MISLLSDMISLPFKKLIIRDILYIHFYELSTVILVKIKLKGKLRIGGLLCTQSNQ